MNAIVRKHYPASRLPEELREGIPEGSEVEVVISVEEPERRLDISKLVGTGQNVHGNEEDVIAYLRALREDR
jgi:hypothetical protein